jgi:hypothetical protein
MDTKSLAKVKKVNDKPIVRAKAKPTAKQKQDLALADYKEGNMSIWSLYKFKR